MKNYSGYGHINVGGQQRPVYFGPMQGKKYCELRGIEWPEYQKQLSEISTQKDPFILIDLLYAALVSGVLYERKTPELTYDDAVFWSAEMEDYDWTAFFKILTDSLSPNVAAPTPEPSTKV